MNYIKHLTGFFENVATNYQLNPTHISLYISIYQCWNLNRFQNPISINRDEIMRISKIASKSTYHKCMNDLHQHGYLKYQPSYNPFKGSLVSLIDFTELLQPGQIRLRRNQAKNQTSIGTGSGTSSETGTEQVLGQALVPSINSINNTNDINFTNESETHACACTLPPEEKQSENSFIDDPQNEMLREKKKVQDIPESIEEVQAFFTQQNYPIAEAQNFYDYYQLNGWMPSGRKTIVRDWKAAVRRWMRNVDKFSDKPKSKTPHLHTTNNKNYAEPL